MSDERSDEATPGASEAGWGPVVIGAVVALVGLAVIGSLLYVDLTTSVTRADYDTYQAGCEDLAGQSRVVDAGMGTRLETLNESDVRTCQNTTYAEYRQQRLASMRSPPLNIVQWGLFGGIGLVFVGFGGLIARSHLPSARAS